MKRTKVEEWEKEFDKKCEDVYFTGYIEDDKNNQVIKKYIRSLLHQQRQEIIEAIEKEAIHISAGLSVKVDCNKNSLVIEKADLRKHLK
jgi:phosphoribosyl-ATP pyrophosphohydrolase